MTTTVGRYRRGQRIDKERQVLVARPSRWGNPFKISTVPGLGMDRETVVREYEKYIKNRKKLLAQLPALRGKELLCYCTESPCHAEVLARLADAGDISSAGYAG